MKKVLSLILAVVMTFLVASCGTTTNVQNSQTPAPSGSASASASASSTPAAQTGKLTIWSHWADEVNKKEFVQTAVDNFKKKNPGFEVEVTWYQKDQLIQALTAALQSGTGPDIFYLEPAITGGFPPFVDFGFMYDLTSYLKPYITDGAMGFSTKGDMIYLLPLEAYTPLIYYNKDILKKANVDTSKTPLNMEQFSDALAKIKGAGFKGLAAGTMDRAWDGSILLSNVILRYAGVEKWQNIATGKTAWNDPDVAKAIKYVEQLVKDKYYPEGVAAIKLGESHGIFFSGEYGMFPMKSFFGGRAFVPVDKGGMAENFPLGIMDMPTVDGGKANNVNYLQVGGSYGVNKESKFAAKAAELLVEMAQPEMANMWMTKVKGQTGLKGDPAKIDDSYLKQLNAVIDSLELIPGPIELGMDATYRDKFYSLSTALVAGQVSADDMIAQLEEARAKVGK